MKMIYCTHRNKEHEFSSVKQASEFLGVTPETVRLILRGKIKRNPCDLRYEKDSKTVFEELNNNEAEILICNQSDKDFLLETFFSKSRPKSNLFPANGTISLKDFVS